MPMRRQPTRMPLPQRVKTLTRTAPLLPTHHHTNLCLEIRFDVKRVQLLLDQVDLTEVAMAVVMADPLVELLEATVAASHSEPLRTMGQRKQAGGLVATEVCILF